MSAMDECTVKGYVAGLIDGEGSFSVSVKKQADLRCRVRLDPVFSITQESVEPLKLVQAFLGCGKIIPKPGQRHLHLFIVDNIQELHRCVLPKLRELPLLAKREKFLIFAEIVTVLAEKWHKPADCCTIRRLVERAYELSELGSKSRRRETLKSLLTLIPCPEAEPPGDR